MTEQVPPTGLQDDETEAQPPTADEPTATGVPAVDQTFERAHESLREALDAEPGDPA
jgi:hypothetical protein